jgi:hypothetical protein
MSWDMSDPRWYYFRMTMSKLGYHMVCVDCLKNGELCDIKEDSTINKYSMWYTFKNGTLTTIDVMQTTYAVCFIKIGSSIWNEIASENPPHCLSFVTCHIEGQHEQFELPKPDFSCMSPKNRTPAYIKISCSRAA